MPTPRRVVSPQVIAIIEEIIGILIALIRRIASPCAHKGATPMNFALKSKGSGITRILSTFLLSMVTLSALSQQLSQDSLINIQVSQNIPTVNYLSRGSTKVGFEGTALLPRAQGEAKVGTRNGTVQIQSKFSGLDSPRTFGSEYLVYVLWAITPEGNATNLGQLIVKDQKSKVDVTTKLQTFGMMVTAEPYFAVSYPSQKVVLANAVLNSTKGSVAEVKANLELLQRGSYSDPAFGGYIMERKVPLDLYQARNAVRIATLQGAQSYAPEALAKAGDALIQAETFQARKKSKAIAPVARQAVQAAEDARAISATREQQAKLAAQQLAAQQAQMVAQLAQQRAQAQAAQEAAQRALAERQKAAAEQQRALAEQKKAAADLAATQAAAERASAEAAARKAQAQARNARASAAQAIAEKEALRARLLAQFNRVLPTSDTSRGLVVNVGDVLFDTGKADLRPAAQIALARLSGILANYPSLRLSIEGHTDSTGTNDFNQKLSERRAEAVQSYVIAQHLPPESISVMGLGESTPVADNASPAGRQKNRRVEIVISGEVIGSTIGS
jgi:outer membrane protein OmpA-like peptidoglycan-associated protein